ncbi:enoyl-CoA hydratase/isomerase family protein [Nocardioides campestrisoli]|uniref:enoyl-CoA hydratase/isomerase family protein n=1 Tax=Nocardioides campestrisoli TaxID=2736757 RepID=UPI00163DD241|nr:enoyl-CoA hydratase-related protein [Nocardioides campestrisoli]
MRHETIEWQVEGGVGTITMNRPGRRNAMTTQMLRELHELLHEVAEDETLAVLVLTGAGDWFCPGADIEHQVEHGPADNPDLAYFDVPALLHTMPAITVAAVNGPCAGAGMGIALACDLLYASSSAKFNTAFLQVGVAGDMGIPWMLQRLVGSRVARELTFFPQKVDAARATDLGLANAVFAPEELVPGVRARAEELAAWAPLARRALKQNHVDAETLGFGEFVALEAGRHLPLLSSEDCREAFAAYSEKRPAVFSGR